MYVKKIRYVLVCCGPEYGAFCKKQKCEPCHVFDEIRKIFTHFST